MNPFRVSVAALLLILGPLFTSTPAVTAERPPAATITMSYDNSGFLIGWHSGDGKLILADGSEYAFTIDGYSVIGFGFSNVTGSGKVYNLKNVSDFSGEYFATGSGGAFGSGGGSANLKNGANDVRLEIVAISSGLRLGFGSGLVTFKLGKRIKGPRPPPIAAKSPPVVVKQASQPPAKPTKYTLLFGYNKSRVNLAMGRVLDSILADWKAKFVTFRLVGHADRVGGSKYNQKLSQKRANAVKQALIKKGVPTSRITAQGVGQRSLAVATPRGKRLRANRRVVITIESPN